MTATAVPVLLVHLASAALLALSATPAWAEPRVVASVAGDFDGNGRADLAVLLGDNTVALAIFEEIEAYGGLRLVAEGPDIAWMGSLNEPPRIEVTEAGSLRVTSSNFGIGRNKWEMALTIAYRRDAYRVAGITFVEVDTLDLENLQLRCDLNLLTGRGTLSGPKENQPERPVEVKAEAVPIEAFEADMVGQLCHGAN